MVSFRPVRVPADLPALTRLLSLTRPDRLPLEQVRERWLPGRAEPRLTTLALDEQGQVVGMADTGPNPWIKPGDYRLDVAVDPVWQRRGIGARLFAEAVRFARAQGGLRLQSRARDDVPEALRFAENRGYRISRHVFQSVLDLGSYDERPFVDRLERARAAGFTFFTMADLEPVTEETRRRLYELNRVTGLDNPTNEGSFPPYEEFCQYVFQASWYESEDQILAADGDRWVGLAEVAYRPETNCAYNVFTGVDQAYRGRGLAYALKVLAIRRARQWGAAIIRTGNDSLNAPMLAINQRLGYQRLPGIYHLVRDLG